MDFKLVSTISVVTYIIISLITIALKLSTIVPSNISFAIHVGSWSTIIVANIVWYFFEKVRR